MLRTKRIRLTRSLFLNGAHAKEGQTRGLGKRREIVAYVRSTIAIVAARESKQILSMDARGAEKSKGPELS